MIVWINGAFGAGKSQNAHELHRRIGRGWISDPELPGFGLHRMAPRSLRGNFALRARGRRVEHFSLIASPAAIRRRLRARFGDAWALAQVDGCVRALAGERYATHVDTEQRSIDEVVEEIAGRAGLALVRPRGGRLVSGLRRVGVHLRHVRIG